MNRLGTPRRTLDRQVQKLSLQVDGEQSSFYLESVYLSFVLSLSKHGRKGACAKGFASDGCTLRQAQGERSTTINSTVTITLYGATTPSER